MPPRPPLLSPFAPILVALAALPGCGPRSGLDPSSAVIVVIPPPLPESTATKAQIDDDARAEREKMNSSDTLLGRWREEFTGRSGCSDEATLTRSGGGLSLSMEDCNTKRQYSVKSVKFDGSTLHVDMAAPESSYPIRYKLRRVQRGLLEGEAAVGEDEEPSRYKVRWVKEK